MSDIAMLQQPSEMAEWWGLAAATTHTIVNWGFL